MTPITSEVAANRLRAYLRHELTLAQLVGWAEQAMVEGEFASADYDVIRDVVSRLGVADVKAFGLTWEDCERLLSQLGYAVRIEVVAK